MSLPLSVRRAKTVLHPLFYLRNQPSKRLLHHSVVARTQPRLSSLTSDVCTNRQFCSPKSSDFRRYLSDSAAQIAKPSSIQEASGRDLVLSPPALVITREYEWANILVGFEQANKYSIRAAPGGQVVGYLAEENSIGRTIARNMLRTHRPFKATVFDKDMNILFTMRRPMYIVSTSIFVETPEGEVLGEVHMNWHLWRRRYGLYVEKTQFASVDSGFLAIDFDMRDVDGKKIASVNKDFTGFARELFTDARQYVIRLDPSFGLEHDASLVSDATTLHSQPEEYSTSGMGHRERAVILASAIAIDFDYFSLHSGPGHPGLMMMPGGGTGGGGGAPVPPVVPPPGVAGAGAEAGTAVGADVLSDVGGAEGGANAGEAPGYGTPVGEGVDEDPYGTPINDPAGTPGDAQGQEWATFEEPDHGFEDPFADESAQSGDSDWSGGDGGEESRGLLGTIMDAVGGIFGDSD